jgi:hypothetical protein
MDTRWTDVDVAVCEAVLAAVRRWREISGVDEELAPFVVDGVRELLLAERARADKLESL